MTRLINANALCKEFKKRQQAALRWKEKAILDCDEERQIRADATLAFLCEVKLTIDNAPTVEERSQEWIPVSEKLPEFSGLYLVSIDSLVTVLNFSGTVFTNNRGCRVEVIAWQPLPEPYKETDNDNA